MNKEHTIEEVQRRIILKGVTGAVATGLVGLGASSVGAQETKGGPIILLGLDSELTPESTDHGTPQEHATMVEALLEDVTNDNNGLLVIGAKPETVTQRYWSTITEAVDEDITLVNGANDIADTAFDEYAMIGITSSDYQLEPIGEWGDPPDGLTDDENEALITRSEDLAEFVNAGGGLLGQTQDGMTNPYEYVDPLGKFETLVGVDEEGYVEIDVSSEGEALGLTQNGMSGWCCWHDVFLDYPDFVDVLVYNRESGSEGENEAAAVGGVVIIPVDVAIGIDGPEEIEVEETEMYDIRVQNIGDEDVPENVRIEVTITREEGIEAGDMAIEYDGEADDEGGGTLQLSDENGSLSGTYGPTDGFSLSEDEDVTVEFRVTCTVPDEYTLELDVVGVGEEADHYANASRVITVGDEEMEAEVTQWPEDCGDIDEPNVQFDDEPVEIAGQLSPDDRDALYFDLESGESVLADVYFEIHGETDESDFGNRDAPRIRLQGYGMSATLADGQPITAIDGTRMNERRNRIEYNFLHSGEYALQFFADGSEPCLRIQTTVAGLTPEGGGAADWMMRLEKNIELTSTDP